MADDTGLRQRGDRWQARVGYDDPLTGKRRWLTATAPTKSEARKLRRELLERKQRGLALGAPRQSLQQYLEDWFRAEQRDGRLSPLTLEGYERNAKRYIIPAIGGVELSRLRPVHIEALLDHLASLRHHRTGEALSSQSRLHAFRVLNTGLERAVRMDLIAYNPCNRVRPPRQEIKEAASLTAEQVAPLLAALRESGSDALHMASLLAVTTGLRRGEVLALHWSDVDLEQAEARIVRSLAPVKGGMIEKAPKTAGSRSVITLPALTVAELKAYRKRQAERRLAAGSMWRDNGLVIDNGIGGHVSPGNLSHSFSQEARKLGLAVTFHGLRHTYASLLMADGQSVKLIAELLRHSSPALVLSTYGHVAPGAHAKAAERLDSILAAVV